MPRNLTCSEYREIACADADGRLSAVEEAAAREHVRSRPGCSAEREAQQRARELVRKIAPRRAPQGLRTRILSATVGTEARTPRRRLPTVRMVLTGAVAALLVLALWPFLRPGPRTLMDRILADVAWAEQAAPAASPVAVPEDDPIQRRLREEGWVLAISRPWEFGEHRGRFEAYRRKDRVLALHRFGPSPPDISGPSCMVRDSVTIYLVPRGDHILCFASRMARAELEREVNRVLSG